MDYETYKNTLEKMDVDEKTTAICLYLKDIKDLLLTILESQNIKPKHY